MDYFILTGNKVLGGFTTSKESWTLEEAFDMAGMENTQETLKDMFYSGYECVFVDYESSTYVLDIESCRILDFPPNNDLLDLCERIRSSQEWDPADTAILCDAAGLSAEWLNATGDDFKAVVMEAADRVGGVIL